MMVACRRVGGEPDGFEAFVRRVEPALLRYAYGYLGDWAAAQDVTAEALATASRKWSSVSTMTAPDQWVFRVASRRGVDVLRRRYRDQRRVERLGSQPVIDAVIPEIDDELAAAVASLPRRQAQVIALRYFEDRTPEEVASLIGVKTQDVYTHEKRAKDRLRVLLEAAVT